MEIFNSNSKESIIQDLGPFKAKNADLSIKGSIIQSYSVISKAQIIGTTKINGSRQIMGSRSK